MKTIPATEASRLMHEAAALPVDVRDADEHARERIPGARNLPLSRIDAAASAPHPGGVLLFHCASGARTGAHAAGLAAWAGPAEAYIVEGGLEAWKRAGLPVERDRRQPIPMMRQVQIAAGSLVLLGVALGALVSPWFFALSGFVGAGLVFAGVSGTCGLARVLQLMPWNRAAA